MIPTQYQWLRSLGGRPNTISLALAEYGVLEVAGAGSNKTILAWRDELNQAGVKIEGYSDDDIPWCGLFTAIVCYRRRHSANEIPASPLWARNWTSYGIKSPQPSLGDVLVFERGSGGHAGFYVAEDARAFHVLGGNQSNRVCISRILKSRLLAARRPPFLTTPWAVKPYYVATAGTLSMNEA